MKLGRGLTLERGRWILVLWAPLVFTVQRDADDDGWRWIGFACPWSKPARWTFPRDPQAAYGADHVLLDGWALGPIDLRRVNPLPDDLAGLRPISDDGMTDEGDPEPHRPDPVEYERGG